MIGNFINRTFKTRNQVLIPDRGKIFLSAHRPDEIWGPYSLAPNNTGGSFFVGITAGE
jgi:hypothetical protein